MTPPPKSTDTKVPAVPGTLAYFMKKTAADGRGNAKNRAYTLYKRQKQALRRGSTTGAKRTPVPKRTPVTSPSGATVTKSDSSQGSGSSKAGKVAATVGAAAAVAGAGFGLAKRVQAKENRMDASARRSNAQQEAKEKRDRAKRRQDRDAAKKRAPDSASKNTDAAKESGRKADAGRGRGTGTDATRAAQNTAGAQSQQDAKLKPKPKTKTKATPPRRPARVSPAEANAKSAKAATNAGRQTPNSGPNARAQTLTGRRYGGLFGLRSK